MTKTQREICKEFRDNREWDKISFASFYQTCRYRTEEEMAEAIQRKKINPYKNKPFKYRWAYPDEYEWFIKQNVEWLTASEFIRRVRQWLSKEEAIQTWEAWQEWMRRRKELAKEKMLKKYEPKRIIKEDNPDYYWIPITLKKEEADVFRKEYQNLLNTIEDELKDVELDIEIKQANEKLNKLKEELKVFNEYNR